MGEDVVVPRRTVKELTRVTGNLKVEDATIRSELPENTVRVEGSTLCQGDCTFECNLHTGSLEGRDGRLFFDGDLDVDKIAKIRDGELYVKGMVSSETLCVDHEAEVGGDLESTKVDIGGTLKVSGRIKADSLDVGGSLHAGSDAEVKKIDVGGSVVVEGMTKSEGIDVGGKFVGKGRFEAQNIDVGGSVEIDSEVDVGKVDVGGSVKVAGGAIRHKVDVGGTFESSKPLKFSLIDVGGKVSIAGGEGGDVDVGGSFKSYGDLTFDRIRVGGRVEMDGEATGESIEVGGSVGVRKGLTLSGQLCVGGKAEVGGQLRAESIRIGGRLEAERAEAARSIETNTLLTQSGAKAQRIEIGKRGEARGPLIAERIIIRDRSTVEDIYADFVELRRGCTARNIYAANVVLESGCRIEGEVRYTQTLRADGDVRFASEPVKSERLPTPPF